ncbi:MAG: hypothetical protein H7Y43_02605 [Akkermansiaceae bacterium]|nr:hypothetical protein [Verrucomicrobiales bacterium]
MFRPSWLKVVSWGSVVALFCIVAFWLNRRPQITLAPSQADSAQANTISPTPSPSTKSRKRAAVQNPEFEQNEFLLTSPLTEEWQTEEMADLLQRIRRLVAASPQDALAWAQRASDPARREQLLGLVWQAWGESDPSAAWSSARALDSETRFSAILSVFSSATGKGDTAFQLARDLLHQEPEDADQYGTAFVGAFTRAGQYSTALKFAGEGPPEFRTNWMASAFQTWAGDQPEEALKAFTALGDQPGQGEILHALVDGWANQKAALLADYSLTLPPGEDRAYALREGMLKWCLQDPASLGEWLNQREATPDYDQGILALVTRTDTANRSTETAVGWAESISDRSARLEALRAVLQEWAETDFSAARTYLETSSSLNPQQRLEFWQSIQPQPEPANED